MLEKVKSLTSLAAQKFKGWHILFYFMEEKRTFSIFVVVHARRVLEREKLLEFRHTFHEREPLPSAVANLFHTIEGVLSTY
jgi:hypothetical protein